MPYIGQEPVAGNFVLLDAITTSATATYALTKNSVAYSPESSRNMIVSLNGVTQAPEAAYTVSGSNITFSSALTASDVIDYILVLGDVLDIGRPSDGVVGTDQMNYPLGNFSSTGIDDNATSTAITIDASENVGIGTASPSSVLHLSTSNDPKITLTDTGFGASADITGSNGNLRLNSQTATIFDMADSEVMRIDSSGDLGIGETVPEKRLHVTDSAQVVALIESTNSRSYLQFRDAQSTLTPLIGCDDNDIIVATGASNTERMRIDASGLVGIGTASPSFAGFGSSTGGIDITNSNNASLRLNGNAADAMFFVSGSGQHWLYGRGAVPMTFSTNATERMRLDTSNRLLLGCTTSNGSYISSNHTQLNIQGKASGAIGSLMLRSQGATNATAFELAASDGVAASYLWNGSNSAMVFGTNNTERMRIDASGNLLVGKTSNDAGYAHQFQSGTSDVTLNAYRPNTSASSSIALFNSDVGGAFSIVCAIRVDGDLENINNSYGALSDERIKSNIVDASSQIDDIMAVQVRSYTLDSTGDTHIGVVAQELEASGMSGLVKENEDGMKSVKYSILYMKAIKALQEAVTRIETLEAEVAALKGA